MRFLLAQMSNTIRRFSGGLRLSALAGSIALLAMMAPHAAFAQDATHDGMFAIQAEGDEDPRMLLLEAAADGGTVTSTGPQIELFAEGPGWVYSPFPLYVVTGSTRPWRMALSATPMVIQDGGDEQVSLDDVYARDALAPTEWTRASGTPMWQNLSGNPEQYLALEFRVNVRYDHKPGHYVSQMTLDWVMPPADGLPASSGSIPMELHLHVPHFFSVSTDVDSLRFPEESGSAEGWIYSETGQLQVTSNQDFQISLSTCEKLTGPEDTQLPTAMMLTNTTPAAPEWAAWGYLGGAEESLPETPWAGDPDPNSPWPGQIGAVQEAFGQTTYDIDFGAWRNGLQDAHGEYSTIIVITVALN